MPKQLKRRSAQGQAKAPAAALPGISPLLSRLYANRGIVSPDEVEYSLGRLLRPELLKGMDAATDLVVAVIQDRQRILVIGDFDADGATSSALLVSGLAAMGCADVDYLVPNRFEYGYGLTPEIVEAAVPRQPDLIITVDNGISSHEGVERANELGMRVLITDHHLPAETLPAAAAIVNPNQPGCAFPSKCLAGVGVAFYLLTAVRSRLRETGWFDSRPTPNLAEYLDLVALGTIADVVPLDYNNRILAQEGVRRIRAGRVRPGIRALIALSGASLERLGTQSLAFGVAPKLNAAGRLEDMSLGIECLLARDETRAFELAQQLNDLNRERQSIEREMKEQAVASVSHVDASATAAGQVGICLFDERWHQGVVGIVASRIKERLHRPVIAFARVSETELKGSARSIEGLHVRDALDAVATRNPGLLDRFGGHAMAAGLSLNPDNLDKFREQFDLEARRWLDDDALKQVMVTDGELDAPFTVPLILEITTACPWGQGFPEPIFDAEVEIVEQRIVAERHLKLKVRPVTGEVVYDAIAFGEDRLIEGRHRRIAFRLDINEYRGLQSVQLIVEALELIEA